MRQARSVPGDRTDLPGAQLRRVEHDDRRGRPRRDRHRSARVHRVCRGGVRPVSPSPWRPADHGDDLHPFARRPLRRRAWPDRRRHRHPDRRSRRLPPPRGVGERLRRPGDAAPSRVHVRPPPASRARGTDGLRPRAGHLHRHRVADRAEPGHHPLRPGGGAGRRAPRVPAHAGQRGAGRDALPLPPVPRPVRGGERDEEPAQPRHPARRAGARLAQLVALHRRRDQPVRRRQRRRLRLAPLADVRAGPRRASTSPSSAICTPTSTTRRCG